MLGKKHFAGFMNKVLNSLANIRSDYWTINNPELLPVLERDLRFVKREHVYLINNGYVDRDLVDYRENQITEYDLLKKPGRMVFISIGRLAEVKNIELFVNAAAEVIKAYDNADFWIIGDGPKYNDIRSLVDMHRAGDRIKMLGYRSDVDVALSRADCFVLTSNSEGSPNAMAEAMRAKKPLISTRCTSLDNFIIEGGNGISVEINNKRQLVEAMKTMLSKSPEELKQMGELSYRLFKENFDINKVADEFNLLYSTLIEEVSK